MVFIPPPQRSISDRKHPLQALRPAQRGGTGTPLALPGLRLDRIATARYDPRAQLMVRGEHAVEARQIHPRTRHQCGQARQKILGLEHHVGRAVPVRRLQRLAEHVRKLPYGRTANTEDPLAVLRQGRGTCSGKHEFLAAIAQDCGHSEVQLTVGTYENVGRQYSRRWHDAECSIADEYPRGTLLPFD
jgi:hypothetical protein